MWVASPSVSPAPSPGTDQTKLMTSIARILPFAVPILALATVSTASSPPIAVDVLVAEIVAQNPERAFYLAEIDAARIGEKLSTRRTDPELSLELGRKRARDRAGVLAGEGTAWAVAVTQTFEWPGRLALRKAIANQQVELAELGLARFERALEAEAPQLAFGLHAAMRAWRPTALDTGEGTTLTPGRAVLLTLALTSFYIRRMLREEEL